MKEIIKKNIIAKPIRTILIFFAILYIFALFVPEGGGGDSFGGGDSGFSDGQGDLQNDGKLQIEQKKDTATHIIKNIKTIKK